MGQDDVVFQSEDAENGIVNFVVNVYSVKKKKAIAYGEKLAVENLLFRGAPGAKLYKNPLCGTDEDQYFSKYPDYFDKMLGENGRYLSFVISGTGGWDKNMKCTVVYVSVNAKALKTDLRTWGIKRFGFN